MKKSYDNFIKLAMEAGIKDSHDFSRLKKSICKKLGVQPPTNADMREHYEKLVAKKEIYRDPDFEKILLSKKIRTQSGVAVVAVLTKAYPCPGKCIYCPSEKEMPKSYLSNEPAVMRAISAKFNPRKQVQNRLRALELNGHQIDKIELIVMGGTFSYLPKNYQTKFIAECFRACNDYAKHKTHIAKRKIDLQDEQKKNEMAKCRIVGLTLETRPDYIDAQEILNFRNLGCTRVELGVQSIFDPVLKINKRGHGIQETIDATKLLKDAGFKINYHIMPGLPGSDLKKDFQMFKELFSNSTFQPDMLKIYPTVVTKNTKLYSMWKKGEYQPLGNAEFAKFILKIKREIIPPFVRIARLVRDVPTSSIMAGPTISNLRQMIAHESQCPCIRCREVKSDYTIGDLPAMLRSLKEKADYTSLTKNTVSTESENSIAKQAEKIILDRINYDASDGKEIFLQYVSANKKKLFALLRLRIPSENNTQHFIPALRNSALIREVHTYGKLAQINQHDKNSPQHIGLGKRLMQEAERITKKEYGLKKIVVISGVGVRNYYRKLGYKLQNTYLKKDI
ncbi:MAG: tRNA uridine(34) 5-carboxymethylaminomethyl modification radical SAM/GNAT enzyme Elp3 [Candidatus Moranbacteria bacterium CG23_combo_of_CG06-09_8_20_14_all_39_10]|nr:MAG: tRNA uridine(34) 5-carboxymethylaminomethyl modification radical SAM/GNAT enzyme Elp3 [Candidatus Moranbacteria bacterium CG23_combo_of_CG06-09_8_20_14_all_39_10]